MLRLTTTRLLVAAGAAAFVFGGAVQTTIGHGRVDFHCAVECHGFVHGSSQTDDHWHSRVEANGYSTSHRVCKAFDDVFGPDSNYIGETTATGMTGTCNYYVAPGGAGGEDQGVSVVAAYAGSTLVISEHGHPTY